MKIKDFENMLKEIGYPNKVVLSPEHKAELIKLHKDKFNKPSSHYRTLGNCGDCYSRLITEILAKKEEKDSPKHKQRMIICKGCQTHKQFKGVIVCGLLGRKAKGVSCGCIINVKSKINNAKCPQGKW